ncbi:MAG: hypothetical protein VB032_00580 [Burkholderiaceae bacterium]|nr:hypothetical protein [Burkholderiaceae bacterium]
MTNPTENPLANEPGVKAEELTLVCDDPTGKQTITFTETNGRQIITCTYRAGETTQTVTLTDAEAAEIIAWKNSGRRNSFWNWPGWAAVRSQNASR